MIIKVTKDKVSIEQKKLNHYGEYNVNECNFEFDEHFNSVLVKRAIFTSKSTNKTIEIDIINNKCVVPSDILLETYDQVTLGVYGYNTEGEELLIRYSPEPTYFTVQEGSYREGAEQPEIITPTQYDMYSKALQEGLAEVDERLDDVEKQGDYASEQGDYAKEQGDYAKSEGDNAKSVAEETEKKAQEGAFDGKSLEFVWEGTKLGVRLEGQEEYHFVDLQGVQGEIGATGEPFKIKKTYGSVSEMNADFGNMQFGDYVMIASSVNEEDNAKLYTRGESAWIFISDFSGAMGIRGETGLTPNIQIGEVKTLEPGSQAKVTRSGSNEEPVFNFEIPKGDKGDAYVLTEEDKVEIGEMVNTEYEERIAENEKDIIDIESYLDTITPKNTAKGELVHITDALNLPTFENKVDGNVKQFTTNGYALADFENPSSMYNLTYDKTTKTYTSKPLTGNFQGVNVFNSKTPITIPIGESTFYYSCELKLLSGIYSGSLNLIRDGTVNENLSSVSTPILNPTISNSYQRYVFKVDYNNTGTEEIKASNYFIQLKTNASEAVLEVKNYMISKQDVPYEPFTNGASPNPQFPSEIEVIEGDLSFKVNGKNLFNIDRVTTGKFIDPNGVLLSNINWNSYLIPVKVLPNTKYIISRNENEVGTYQFVITEYDKNGQLVKRNDYYNTGTYKYTVTTSENTSFVYLGYRIDLEHSDIQFELGDKRTTFEPYKEQIVYLDLKGNFIGKINDNIKDYLVTDKKKYWLVKNVGKVVLDGSEDILRRETSTTGLYRFVVRLNLPNIVRTESSEQSQLISNRFYGTNRDYTWSLKQGIAYGTSDNYYGDFVIYSDVTKEMTVEEFKQWLSENNVEIYYQLAEPEIIDLGKLEEPIKTFEGVNNIQLLANLDTEIEVTYVLDVKKYFENKLAEISAQII